MDLMSYMKKRSPWFICLLTAGLLMTGLSGCYSVASQTSQEFDTVLLNGRVMDPESGLNAVRNVGIRGGRVEAITDSVIRGRTVVDVAGKVVAPGFIDLHAHGQTPRDAKIQAQDGVTTALDMESGVFPVAAWYEQRKGQSPIHFGASAGYLPSRIKLKTGLDVGHTPTTDYPNETLSEAATEEEIGRLLQLIDTALNEGGLGVGIGLEYVPGASRMEILRVFQAAARHGACAFVHVRSSGMAEPASGLASMQEVLANAAATGACLHIVHVTSSALYSTPIVLEMIDAARARGMNVTTEVYPYTAASTLIGNAYFSDGWQQRLRISYGDLQWAATGERLTEATFKKYRREQRRGWVIVHSIPAAMVDTAIKHPAAIIASDGTPFRTGGEHPRGAGTFSRVLGYYVRERGLLSLMDALRKMTLQPAQRLERFVPQMRQKGRLRVGSDADITVFDAMTIKDRATYDKDQSMLSSTGIVHVLVNGSFVVRAGQYVEGVFPGQGIRRNPNTSPNLNTN